MTDIKVSWKDGVSVSDWPEKCIRIMESFGLPGDKYITHVTEGHMVFSFVETEDAVMARLMIGD